MGRDSQPWSRTLGFTFLWFCLSGPCILSMTITLGTNGTDDALLASGSTANAIIEGQDTCSDANNCYVSADKVQELLSSSNVILRCSGILYVSSAPTSGNFSNASTSLTLGAGDSGTTDSLRITSAINMGNAGDLVIESTASSGVICIIGTSYSTGSSAAKCTDSGGDNTCSANGLLCVTGTELQLISASNLYFQPQSGTTGSQISVNGLTAADTSQIASTLYLKAEVSGFSSADNNQVIFQSADSTVNCDLRATAYRGVAVEVVLTATGGSNGGDIYMNGDTDSGGTDDGAIAITTSSSGNTLISGGAITMQAQSEGILYGGAGQFELSAAKGITMNSNVQPSTTLSREITLNCDSDSTGEGTFTIASGVTMGSTSYTRDITITASDIAIGSTSTTIQTTSNNDINLVLANGKTIGVGVDVSSSGGMSISASEVQSFSTSVLNIGGSGNSGILAGGLTQTNTANFLTLNLQSTSSTNGTITFQTDSIYAQIFEATAAISIYMNIPTTIGITTTYFTGTLTLTVTGTTASGASGIILADSTYFNAQTKLTLKSASGITANGGVNLNGADGVQIDGDFAFGPTVSGALTINADTDGGGLGVFTLCGSDADTLAGSLQLCDGSTREVDLTPGSGQTVSLSVSAITIAVSGNIKGSTSDITLAPAAQSQTAIGDRTLTTFTLTETEMNRISGTGTLTIGSSAMKEMYVGGVNVTSFTGTTVLLAGGSTSYLLMEPSYFVSTSTFGGNVSFAGPLTLRGNRGVFVNVTTEINGDFTVDANYDSAGATSFYCVNGNQKSSCNNDTDCGRALCGDGETFCPNGAADCTSSGTACNVPTFFGSCVSEGEFRLGHSLVTNGGSVDVTADVLHIENTWDGDVAFITAGAGSVSVGPKTSRSVRLGLSSGLKPYDFVKSAETSFEFTQAELDKISFTGSLIVGNTVTSSMWVRGLTHSPGDVTLRAQESTSSFILLNSTGCSSAASCAISVSGKFTLQTSGTCTIDVDISAQFFDGSCALGTSQSGLLTITGSGSPLVYEVIGDLVITGSITNRDSMTFNATGSVNITASMSCQGAMKIISDVDGDGTGDFEIASGQSLTSNNNPITIFANNLFVKGTIDAGTADMSIEISDGGRIGLNDDQGSAGMSLSSEFLTRLTCRNLTIGGRTNGIVISDLRSSDLASVSDFLLLSVTKEGGTVSFEDSSSASRRRMLLSTVGYSTVTNLDVSSAGTIYIKGNLTSTAGVIVLRGNSVANLTQHGLIVSPSVSIVAESDLLLDGGTGSINFGSPNAILAQGNLDVYSDAQVNGTGLLQLKADSDGNNLGSLTIHGKILKGAINTTGGTMLLEGEAVNLNSGTLLDHDQGDLLVTASNFGDTGSCKKTSSFNMVSFNVARSPPLVAGSGKFFFDTIRAKITQIRSDKVIYDDTIDASNPVIFDTAGQANLLISGSVFDASSSPTFTVFIGDFSCPVVGLRTTPISNDTAATGVSNATDTVQPRLDGFKAYQWNLLNGTTIFRHEVNFTVTCAVPKGVGVSLDATIDHGCDTEARVNSVLKYQPPLIQGVEPKNASYEGNETVTVFGRYFGYVCPANSLHCTKKPGPDECCGEHIVDVWLQGNIESPSGPTRCKQVDWLSDSSVACKLPRSTDQASTFVVDVARQRSLGAQISFRGASLYYAECANFVIGSDCPSGNCKRDCQSCCRRSCQLQTQRDNIMRLATLTADPYTQCAVLCDQYCSDAP